MRIEVVRSTRRKKTVELRPTADGVRISIPASASKAEEEKYVETLLRRYENRRDASAVDLEQRAVELAGRYQLQTPASIKWAENQNSRWGSCTPETRTIRISSHVAKFPSWVIDYVIIHELVHLGIHGHGEDFWRVVERYPKTERARGFLIAKGLEVDEAIERTQDSEVLD